MSSVCVGLILTLCALVIRVSCFKDFQKLQEKKEHLVPESDGVDESSESEEEEDEDSPPLAGGDKKRKAAPTGEAGGSKKGKTLLPDYASDAEDGGEEWPSRVKPLAKS